MSLKFLHTCLFIKLCSHLLLFNFIHNMLQWSSAIIFPQVCHLFSRGSSSDCMKLNIFDWCGLCLGCSSQHCVLLFFIVYIFFLSVFIHLYLFKSNRGIVSIWISSVNKELIKVFKKRSSVLCSDLMKRMLNLLISCWILGLFLGCLVKKGTILPAASVDINKRGKLTNLVATNKLHGLLKCYFQTHYKKSVWIV